jgi:putative endopeptidase
MQIQKKIYTNTLLFSLGGLLLFSACGQPGKKLEANIKTTDPLAEHRDTSMRAGDDFFTYTNGAWFKANPIPAAEKGNGIFLIVQDSINSILRLICDDCSKNPGAKGTVRQKIGDFYASGMDTITREQEKLKPIQQELDLIDQMKDKKDLLQECAHLHTIGSSPMFSFWITRDDKISSKYAAFISQGGLGLPERDYYFNTDARTQNIREKYQEHMVKTFALSGEDEIAAKKSSELVFAIEKDLAGACRKMEDLRDPYKNYNKMSIAAFSKLSPSIDWSEMFSKLGVSGLDTVITGQPEFVQALDKKIKNTTGDLSGWKAYYKWKILGKLSRYMGKAFEDEDFHFNSTVMAGSTEQKPRWKRMVELTEGTLEEVVSQEYVAHYVPAGTKERLTVMAKNILDVYADHLKNLDWMSEPTKAKALHKLNGVVMKMGYPDKWKDYSTLDINRTSLVTNILHAEQWSYNYMITKYGKPVDRTEWIMTAETYNAYYEPTNNEIVIPACNFIVPGFGNGVPDDAVLYGVIGGSTMGHEITHGFDDEGSQYDEKGNLNDWWTKEDRAKFNERSKNLAEEFNKYTVLDSLHVRGMATLGENIADLGGVIMGYEAFKKTDQWKKQVKINGLTPDQRYFMAYAYSWMTQQRNQSAAKQIMSDVHAPAKWRVNGPLSNITAFYTTFGVKQGDKMYREEKDRVKIW